jgi:hypothetical protein
MVSRGVVGIALLVSCTIVAGAGAPGFLGFDIGGRLSAEVCPPHGSGVRFPPICIQYVMMQPWLDQVMADTHRVVMDADRKPDWVQGVTVTSRGGEVLEVSLLTSGIKSQEQVLGAVTTRLGKPSSVDKKLWHHKKLGSLVSFRARWRGVSWEADFDSADEGTVDSGVVVVRRLVQPTRRSNPPL